MIKVTILTLALVAGLVAEASTQEKTEQPADDLRSGNIGVRDASFARQLGFKLYRSCDNNDKKAFAANLADESSDAYRCATRQLADPEALTFILRFVPRLPEGVSSLDYLNKIRNHMFHSSNLKMFDVLVFDAKRACQSYVTGTAPILTEAGTTTDSTSYENELVARNACQVLLKTDFGKEFVAKFCKHANKMYDEEKKRLMEDKQRRKDYRRRQQLLYGGPQ